MKKKLTAKEIGRRAHTLYNQTLRKDIETEENIGKIVLLDVETGQYEIDSSGLHANQRLRSRFPNTDPYNLFAIRIGYDAVYAIGSSITRTAAE